MIIDLVRKEYIESSSFRDVSTLSRKILLCFLKLIAIGLFIALEVFIYISVDQKVNANSDFGSFDFLVLISSLTLLISIIFVALKARKTLFNSFDKSILLPLPVTKGEIVFSKVLYLYVYQTILNIIISSPILIPYFVLHNYLPPYYVFGVVYAALISLFGIGVSLILALLFEYAYRILKLSDIAQFIFGSVLVILLCFAYQIVLNLFLDALNNNVGTGMFSTDLIELVHDVSLSLFPVYTFLDPVVNGIGLNLWSSICIDLGMVIMSIFLGAVFASISYSLSLSNLQDKINKKKNKNNLVLSPFKALVKKEFSLLFKDSSYTFSYTALLIMAPFLSFVVISSLNSIIYQNLRYFSIYYPDLVNGLNICLILLFASVINSGASQSITREGNALQVVKYIPVDPLKQVAAKVVTPIFLSSLSLLITLIVLISTGNIDYKVFLITLFLGLCLLTITTINGLYFDMYDRRSDVEMKLSFVNTLISVIFPFVILLIHFGVSLVRIDTFYIYIFEAITGIIVLLPTFVNPKKRWQKVFRKMEVA